jgi:hypothetical protein
MHEKRRQRGAALNAPSRERRDPYHAFMEAVIAYTAAADAEDDEQERLAMRRVRQAAQRWARWDLAQRLNRARSAALTPSQRSEYSRRAANARWSQRRGAR